MNGLDALLLVGGSLVALALVLWGIAEIATRRYIRRSNLSWRAPEERDADPD